MSEAEWYGCYWPDHTRAYNQTSCNSEANASWCCEIGDICLDNGYCLQKGPYSNRLGRGACTDSTWSSPACPQQCADTRLASRVGLFLAFDRRNGAFCCDVNFNTTTGLCNVGTRGSRDPFDLPAGNVIYNRTNGAVIRSGTLTLAELDLPSNSSITPSTTPSSEAQSSSSSSAAAISPTSTSTSTSNTSVLPVAVGIAVPLGVLLIAAVVACFFLFRQNRKLRRQLQDAHGAAPSSAVAPNHVSYSDSVSSPGPAPMYEYSKVNQQGRVHEVPAQHVGELSGESTYGHHPS